MKIREVYNDLKSLLKLKDYGKEPNETGEFLLFTGTEQVNTGRDLAKFKILINSRSFNFDNEKVLGRIDEIRKILFHAVLSNSNDLKFDIDFKGFEDSLYTYEINLYMQICRGE